MNTRQFLKTLCLVPLGAVVEKLPGHGVAETTEPQTQSIEVKVNGEHRGLMRKTVGAPDIEWQCWQADRWVILKNGKECQEFE